jgi:hypothetical protein
MAEFDAFGTRGRSFEDDYIRKRDRELIEKIRQASAAEDARQAMGQKTGLSDPALLEELQQLGFTPETVSLVPLLPVVQVAWAEGGVSDAERELVIRLARSRGIEAGSDGDQRLHDWLARRPSDAVFERGGRLIRALFDAAPANSGLTANDLVKYCEEIAAASGGFLGIGRISGEERVLLEKIAAGLTSRQNP